MNYVDISTVENMLRFAHAHGNIVSVTFTKRDGSIRNMVARFSYRGTVGGERAYDPDLKKLSLGLHR